MHNATDGKTGPAILRSVVALASELGMNVVAEGVESPEDVSFLRSIGCGFAQGFYFGEPMSQKDVIYLLEALAKEVKTKGKSGLFDQLREKSGEQAAVAAPAVAEEPPSPIEQVVGAPVLAPERGAEMPPAASVAEAAGDLPAPQPIEAPTVATELPEAASVREVVEQAGEAAAETRPADGGQGEPGAPLAPMSDEAVQAALASLNGQQRKVPPPAAPADVAPVNSTPANSVHGDAALRGGHDMPGLIRELRNVEAAPQGRAQAGKGLFTPEVKPMVPGIKPAHETPGLDREIGDKISDMKTDREVMDVYKQLASGGRLF